MTLFLLREALYHWRLRSFPVCPARTALTQYSVWLWSSFSGCHCCAYILLPLPVLMMETPPGARTPQPRTTGWWAGVTRQALELLHLQAEHYCNYQTTLETTLVAVEHALFAPSRNPALDAVRAPLCEGRKSTDSCS